MLHGIINENRTCLDKRDVMLFQKKMNSFHST